MKYGLVVYKDTTNIGDDVQCYAAAQFLPRVDVMLDREHLDDVQSDEPIAVIMNGWFLHKKWNWPPAACIVPHYIAFHYSEYECAAYYGKYIKQTFLSGEGLQHLKRWEPIGCRDLRTKEILTEKGVDCYFSGCMTLTLPKMPKTADAGSYVCLTDLDPRALKFYTAQAKNRGIEIREMTQLMEKHSESATWEERAKRVEDLLTIYQNAKCVVTSRLHCALPCLAMGTPVLLVRKDLDNTRFQPYSDWLYSVPVSGLEAFKDQYDIANPPKNKDIYLDTREKLIASVKEFIAHCEEKQPSSRQDPEEVLKWQREIMKVALEDSLTHYNEDIKKISLLQKTINKFHEAGLKQTIKKIIAHLKGWE